MWYFLKPSIQGWFEYFASSRVRMAPVRNKMFCGSCVLYLVTSTAVITSCLPVCSEKMLWCSSGREGKAGLHHLSWCDNHSASTSPCALLKTLVSCCHWPDFCLQSSTQQPLQGWCSAQACLALLPVPTSYSSLFPSLLPLSFLPFLKFQ